MSRGVKIIALLVALLLTGGLVTGIAFWSVGSAPVETTQTAGLFDGDKQIENPGVMLTVGTHEVSFEEYRYFYLTTMFYTAYGDPAYWESDFDGKKAADLKEQTENAIAQNYAIIELGKTNGIELTPEEEQEVLDTVAADKEEFGADFEQRLRDTFITSEELYAQVIQNQKLIQKIQTEMIAKLQGTASEDIFNEAISAQHILIAPFTTEDPASLPQNDGTSSSVGNGNGNAASQLEDLLESTLPVEGDASSTTQDPDAAMENARTLAEQIVAEIRASQTPTETFAKMRAEYDADSQGQPAEGYTFVEGDMVTPFYEGAKALEVGQISDPIKTDYGYHIILRMPLDEEYVKANLMEGQASAAFQKKVEELADTLEIVPGEFYHLVSPQNIR